MILPYNSGKKKCCTTTTTNTSQRWYILFDLLLSLYFSLHWISAFRIMYMYEICCWSNNRWLEGISVYFLSNVRSDVRFWNLYMYISLPFSISIFLSLTHKLERMKIDCENDKKKWCRRFNKIGPIAVCWNALHCEILQKNALLKRSRYL